jgi:hypothetical protein
MREQSLAFGFIMFAGIIMVVLGAFQALQGLVAIFEDTFYVVSPNYWLEFDVTAWGWIHLIAGIIVSVAGVGLLAGQTWARAVAIAVAGLSAIINFMFIPYYPVWSLLIIALNTIVIWAVAVHGRELAA